ncbi:hypothetical protein B0H66DRAFT_123372 [Apodospora peruviana]|uniref:Urease accessory protein UreF n=1 Tax=Apodospora peruviana TaxID=516989 RepID=A0AAE0MAX1_9PEZI|nr:hypothetical protein B0H66DRAFT_123372 [Apodospora peruviana]
MLSPDETVPDQDEALASEIADLERSLAIAKAKAKARRRTSSLTDGERQEGEIKASPTSSSSIKSPANHFFLLLSDSALPLGSFAFSSGLESYLAHNKPPSSSSFSAFLPLSLSSYASTTLPFLLAAHRSPARLPELDDTLDATIICTVGRRASVAQGRALLSIWDRAFSSSLSSSPSSLLLKSFTAQLRGAQSSSSDELPAQVSAHLAPLFGVISHLVGLSLEQTAYVFMLGHVKALVSAAVRAGMFGPYQAQKTLAGEQVQALIAAMIEREWDTPIEEAGQSVPVMDLWFGRHEVLYSRIFNS